MYPPSEMSFYIELSFQGQALSTGTAFCVDSPVGPVLVTNRHNVTGRHQETGACLHSSGGVPSTISIHFPPSQAGGNWVIRDEPLFDATDERLWIEHPTLGEKADFVALPLSRFTATLHGYDPANPGPSFAVGPSEQVSVIGYPLSMRIGDAYPVWSNGFVASEPEVDYAAEPVFLIECRTFKGQSGSPVIRFQSGGMANTENVGALLLTKPAWRFLGIYSGRLTNGSDLGKVWKASAIAELIASIPTKKTAVSILSTAGHYTF